MMTGRPPHEHRLLLFPKPGKLDADVPTIASTLKRAGYKTAAFHGGGFVRKVFGLDTGFDTYESKSRRFPQNIRAAMNWVDQHRSDKFFLFVHGYDVHRPYNHHAYNRFHNPTPALKAKYNVEGFCRHENRQRKGDELAYIVAQYDAGIVAADMRVGRLLRHLRRRGLLERSIVIITSDHGDELFEHGGCDHKHTVYRELVHVPLVVRYPEVTGRRIPAQVAASLSLLPTTMRLLGFDSPVGFEYDLIAALDKPNGQPAILTETGRWHGVKDAKSTATPTEVQYYKRSLTTPAHKLIYGWRRAREGGKVSWELYDVQTDVGEQHDLYSDGSPAARALTEQLFEGPPALPINWTGSGEAIDPETAQQLEALGYME